MAENIEPIYTDSFDWTPQHEKILIDWADKATCYKWLHEKTTREYEKKNRWFTIPVIIMSTLAGTANFAQNNIPAEYLTAATMSNGAVNLLAGILTTIQQFLKISELNESHRVSSISWGKFQRNIKVELAKSPLERTPVTQLIKTCKEEFDRLIETSQDIPKHLIVLFKNTFSGGEIKYDAQGIRIPLTDKQLLYNELIKPEICDSLESVKKIVYKAPPTVDVPFDSPVNTEALLRAQKKAMLDAFILSFETEKKRIPTPEEIQDNIDDSVSMELIQTILSDIECKDATYASVV